MNAETLQPALPDPERIRLVMETVSAYPQLADMVRTAADQREQVTVQAVIDAYLAQAAGELAEASYRNCVQILSLFAAVHGQRRVAECTPLDLDSWLRAQKQWPSAWTIKRALVTVLRSMNWAVEMRMIRENPFRGVKRAVGDRRRPMKLGEYLTLLRHGDGGLRRLLFFLRTTGARPGEARALRRDHIDWERSVAILHEHKTKHKTDRPRIIALVPVVVRLLRLAQTATGTPADCSRQWLCVLERAL